MLSPCPHPPACPQQAQLNLTAGAPLGDEGTLSWLAGLRLEHFYGLLIVMLPFNSGCHSMSARPDRLGFMLEIMGLGLFRGKTITHQSATNRLAGAGSPVSRCGRLWPQREPGEAGLPSRTRQAGQGLPSPARQEACVCVRAQLSGKGPSGGRSSGSAFPSQFLGALDSHVYGVTLSALRVTCSKML